jgi:hypothetical protein
MLPFEFYYVGKHHKELGIALLCFDMVNLLRMSVICELII